MDSTIALEVIVRTVFATLFAFVGVLSIGAALRWRAARTTALLLAWAMLQHTFNELTSYDAVRTALGIDSAPWRWASLVGGYTIAVPWALLVERVVGRGWRSSIRRTWQVILAYAVVATAIDAWTGQPGRMAAAGRYVVAAGALVGFANVLPAATGPRRSLGVLFAGYLAFMVLVVHDTLANGGLLPWRENSGALGPMIFVGCLAYTVVTRTLQGQRDLQAIEHELATATRIQTSLLPAAAPELDGGAIHFRYVPAAAVAGDVFEFLNPDRRRVGVLVADVSGHGVPAALIASMVKVAAAAQREHADDPSRVLAGIHLALANELPRGQFVTAVYVYIDLDRRIIRHAAAGHPPALLYRDSERTVTPMGPSGPLLISFAPSEYPLVEAPLRDNDRIVLYTDGIIEAMRADEEMFGVERLAAVVAAAADGAASVASGAIDAVMRFRARGGAPLDDDCTIVAIQVGSRGTGQLR